MLDDGERTYLYGVNRIAQANPDDDFAYFHGDALGSVRQLTDAASEVTLAKGFTPYGDDLYEIGNADTNYGFTSEWSDVTGLVYLRARNYSPWDGRFLSRDPWSGDYYQPMSLNDWIYVEANPINYTDPLGLYSGQYPPNYIYQGENHRDLTIWFYKELHNNVWSSWCKLLSVN